MQFPFIKSKFLIVLLVCGVTQFSHAGVVRKGAKILTLVVTTKLAYDFYQKHKPSPCKGKLDVCQDCDYKNGVADALTAKSSPNANERQVSKPRRVCKEQRTTRLLVAQTIRGNMNEQDFFRDAAIVLVCATQKKMNDAVFPGINKAADALLKGIPVEIFDSTVALTKPSDENCQSMENRLQDLHQENAFVMEIQRVRELNDMHIFGKYCNYSVLSANRELTSQDWRTAFSACNRTNGTANTEEQWQAVLDNASVLD